MEQKVYNVYTMETVKELVKQERTHNAKNGLHSKGIMGIIISIK